jgi:hypothetical protein
MSSQLGKLLILVGGFLLISGVLILLLGRFINLERLPGTLRVELGGWRLEVPVLASILLSIFLTVVLNLLLRLFRH